MGRSLLACLSTIRWVVFYNKIKNIVFKKPIFSLETYYQSGGSPGLVVMRGDSCPGSHEFGSKCRVLDGSLLHLFVVKIVLMMVKTKNK